MYYWVIQIVRGSYVKHGPYKSREAAANRYQRVKGGEVHLFKSWSDNPGEVEMEFRDEQTRRL